MYLISRKLLYCYIVILLFGCGFVFVNHVFAADTVLGFENCDCNNPPSITDSDEAKRACAKYCSGSYEINDFLRIAINVSQIILGATGSIALLAFIYGGATFLTSLGNRERVEKGKRIIYGAVVGLLLVFLSYTIVGFVFSTMGLEGANWGSTSWFTS